MAFCRTVPSTTFASMLQHRQVERRLTGAQVADALGFSPGRYSQLLAGDANVSPRVIARAAAFLEMPAALLAGIVLEDALRAGSNQQQELQACPA